MNDNLIIQDLLRVLSPGRRRLSEKQRKRQHEVLLSQKKLIKEYQSLASLPKCVSNTNSLGVFDTEEFKQFIKADERLVSWESAQTEIGAFDLPEMAGGVNPGDQRLIFHLLKYLMPMHVLEIGTHIGASTVHVASALKRFPNSTIQKLITVDIRDVNCTEAKPWKAFGSQYSPREMINQLQCSEIVDFVTSSSVEFLTHDQESYDFIFLDGDHSAQAVYQEIPLALDRLAHGGCILLHDYFPCLEPLWGEKTDLTMVHTDVIPGVYLAVQRLQREGADFKVTPFGELPWKTKLGSNVTSLALLSRVNRRD